MGSGLNGNCSKLPLMRNTTDLLNDKWLNKECEFSPSLARPLRHYIAQIILLMLVNCPPKCD